MLLHPFPSAYIHIRPLPFCGSKPVQTLQSKSPSEAFQLPTFSLTFRACNASSVSTGKKE